MPNVVPTQLIGREPERLTIEERRAVTGKWMAIEIYTPAKLPLRRIAALGDSQTDCIAQLNRQGLDPRDFEFSMVEPAY